MAGPRLEAVVAALADLGEIGERTSSYLRDREVRIAFTRQRHSGARWFDWRSLRSGVFLNEDLRAKSASPSYLASLVVHEVAHLRQGVRGALSVRGELLAWQAQRAALDRAGGLSRDRRWREIQAIDGASEDDLRRARRLMKSIGGPGYHIELLPLEPAGDAARRAAGAWVRRIRSMFGPAEPAADATSSEGRSPDVS